MKRGITFRPHNFDMVGYLIAGSLTALMLLGWLRYEFEISLIPITATMAILLIIGVVAAVLLSNYIKASRQFNQFVRGLKLEGYPIVFYKHSIKDNKRYFYIKDQGEPYTQKLIDSVESLAKAYSTVILSEKTDRQGKEIVMEYRMIKQEKMNIREGLIPNKGFVFIAPETLWDYHNYPHGLIVGRTGEGKSVLALSIMRQLRCHDVKVYYMDPKNSGKTKRALEGTGVEYHSNPHEIRELMIALRKEAYERTEAMNNYSYLAEDFEHDWRDIVIVFDELAALPKMVGIDKKTYTDIMDAFQNIIYTGRESCVQIIALCQSADAAVFGEKQGAATRSNFGFRCAMGVIVDDERYKMIFPEMKKVELKRHEKGAGLACMAGDERPREIIVPFFTDIEGGAEEDATKADDDSTGRL